MQSKGERPFNETRRGEEKTSGSAKEPSPRRRSSSSHRLVFTLAISARFSFSHQETSSSPSLCFSACPSVLYISCRSTSFPLQGKLPLPPLLPASGHFFFKTRVLEPSGRILSVSTSLRLELRGGTELSAASEGKGVWLGERPSSLTGCWWPLSGQLRT